MGKSKIQLIPGEEIISESKISGAYKFTMWFLLIGFVVLSFSFSLGFSLPRVCTYRGNLLSPLTLSRMSLSLLLSL